MSNKADQKEATAYFSSNPGGYADSYSTVTPEGYSFRVREDRLLEMLGTGNGRLLDIGCGPAVMTEGIRKLGWKYEGADISANMIAEAKRRSPGVPFFVAPVEHIPAPDNSYDTVTAMGLVEYVENDEAAVREMKRVTAPGGRIFISLPNWWSPLRMWDRYLIAPASKTVKAVLRKKSAAVFHREYRAAEYRALLASCGLTPVATVAYNIRILPRPFDNWFPKISVAVSKAAERAARTPLSFIATGVIVEAHKPKN
jgi:ubiquinone/menaquinone biosynthesis C-methylase UbiE